ncbi:MAG: heme-copper oxidase subunit III [Bryobacteraceae bacterium]|nr:heme-copper oxidase subunit III [Bryobacteraceae bacterium]
MNGEPVDVRRLSVYHFGNQGPLYWGILGVLAIESVVFGSLIASYLYMRMGEVQWPPPGTAEPKLLLPTIYTAILLASSIPVYWGDSGIERNDARALRWGMLIGIAMALGFLALKAIEYSDIDYFWNSHAYGSIVWAISGFHALHVLSLVLKTIVIDILAWRGYFNAERRLGVTINGIYWHFVVVVWIPLYFLIYWSPRML